MTLVQLAIVRQIVSLSGGRLGVRSQRSTGSCFWFELGFEPASTSDIETTLLASNSNIPDRHRSPRSDTSSQGVHARLNVMDPTASPSLDPPPPRRAPVVGWADPDLITKLSEQGELRVPRPSSARNAPDRSALSVKPVVLLEPPAASTSTAGDADAPRAPMHKSKSYPTRAGPEEPPPAPLAMPEGSLSVLVVDDDSLTRKLLQRMLERLGCSVVLAEDGKEAIDILLGTGDKPPQVFDMISLGNKSSSSVAQPLDASCRQFDASHVRARMCSSFKKSRAVRLCCRVSLLR
jgi:hypothetical protein